MALIYPGGIPLPEHETALQAAGILVIYQDGKPLFNEAQAQRVIDSVDTAPILAAMQATATQAALDAIEKPAAKTDLRALVSAMDAIINNADTATNAQLRTMVVNLARAVKRTIRLVA